jgi:hypothetical protein
MTYTTGDNRYHVGVIASSNFAVVDGNTKKLTRQAVSRPLRIRMNLICAVEDFQ